MTALAIAVGGGFGVYLVYTALAFGWRGIGVGPAGARRHRNRHAAFSQWLAQAGLAEVRPRDFVATSAAVGIAGAIAALAVFGGVLPAAAAGAFAATVPYTVYRN